MGQKKITDLQLKASVLGTENLPVDDTIQSYRVTFSQVFDYIRSRIFPEVAELSNLTIVPSVAANALTIAVKTKAGTNATATDLIRVGMRNATLTSGSYNTRTITAALSMVVSSGSTLGQVSGQASRIYVYLIDNGGVLELAVSSRKFRENELVSTTAEGGAGAADAADVMYSTTARTSVPCRLIGYIDNTQATAGTWTSAGTQVQLFPFLGQKAPTIQKFTSGSGTYYVPAGCSRIRVRLAGGGGGGAGSGGASASTGGGGGATTFGTTLLSGSAGAGGGGAGPGAGGGASLGTGPVGIAMPGQAGGSGSDVAAANTYIMGGMGGQTPFGGAGTGGVNSAGNSAQANSGGGGGGGGGGNSVGQRSGGGGGAGGYVEAFIDSSNSAWARSFAYAVGAGGTAGPIGGTAGSAGGSGGSGFIIIEEFYD